MNDVTIVGDYFSKGSEDETGVRIIDHVMSTNVTRTKVVLQNYLFSFLIEGVKNVYTVRKNFTIDEEKFIMLLPGNYLMTETITSSKGNFQTVLLFFTQNALHHFLEKHPNAIKMGKRKMGVEQAQVFVKDDFLRNYIQSLSLLIKGSESPPRTLLQVKLEELLLYLCHHHPESMESLKSLAENSVAAMEIKKLVEANLTTNITLEELAFLSGMSLSTFKRRFIEVYGLAPSKWFLQKRMEMAVSLLKTSKERPSEIYYKVGYESHSSFTHSFKQVFGVTPTEYKERSFS